MRRKNKSISIRIVQERERDNLSATYEVKSPPEMTTVKMRIENDIDAHPLPCMKYPLITRCKIDDLYP